MSFQELDNKPGVKGRFLYVGVYSDATAGAFLYVPLTLLAKSSPDVQLLDFVENVFLNIIKSQTGRSTPSNTNIKT